MVEDGAGNCTGTAGEVDPAAHYVVRLGNQSTVVSGEQLTDAAVGPFMVQPHRVTALSPTRANPPHPFADLNLSVDAATVRPDPA